MAQQKKCVVLGGNGFIGSTIVDVMSTRRSLEIVAFDRYAKGPQFTKKPNVSIVDGSVFDYELLDKTIKDADYVVHCLSATNPFTSDEDPYADIDSLKKNITIFEHCVKLGVKKIIFISSGGAVYGKLAETKKVSEEHAPMPVSPYGITKLATEHYLEYFKRKYGTDYVVCRLTNPYGPRQVFKQAQGVIPAFINQILKNKPITIYGDGSMSRDYIYVEDAAKMITKLALNKTKKPVYNVGSGKQTSLQEILDECRKYFDKDVKVDYKPAPKTFLQKTDVSIRAYVAEFGQPTLTPFEKGLASAIKSNPQ